MLQNQTLGLLSIVVLIAACQKDCITVSSIKDYSLIGHTYKTTSGRSLMTCIITCDQDTNCYSFNYKFPDKICELNNVTQSLHPLEFVSSPGAIYFDQPSRPSGSCLGDRPCKNKGKCENVARAPGFKCECQYNYTGERCEVCSSPPLGMQDGRILNHQLTASSVGMWFNLQSFEAKDARLRFKSLSWVSGMLDFSPWLQVSFAPEIKIVSGIATQGNPSHDWWTTSYTLKHSMTGKIWRDYEKGGFEEIFLGNTDGSLVVKHAISPPIKASFIRVLPLTKYVRFALRIELYGCDFINE